jgi:DNA-binding GntR family transcriptional regulator
MAAYQTKRDIALTLLRDAIMKGEIAPGARIPVDEFTQRFDLSLTPIREALPILEAEGFITQVPHRGAVVTPMDWEEIVELYTIRIGMESLATRRAVPNLTAQQIQNMRHLCERMEIFQGDWADFLQLDRQFHLVLYQAAGSQRWLDTIELYWRRSTRYMLASTAMSGAIEKVHADHRVLLEHCEARDAPGAERVLRDHLEYSLNRLVHEWEQNRGK